MKRIILKLSNSLGLNLFELCMADATCLFHSPTLKGQEEEQDGAYSKPVKKLIIKSDDSLSESLFKLYVSDLLHARMYMYIILPKQC